MRDKRLNTFPKNYTASKRKTQDLNPGRLVPNHTSNHYTITSGINIAYELLIL